MGLVLNGPEPGWGEVIEFNTTKKPAKGEAPRPFKAKSSAPSSTTPRGRSQELSDLVKSALACARVRGLVTVDEMGLQAHGHRLLRRLSAAGLLPSRRSPGRTCPAGAHQPRGRRCRSLGCRPTSSYPLRSRPQADRMVADLTARWLPASPGLQRLGARRSSALRRQGPLRDHVGQDPPPPTWPRALPPGEMRRTRLQQVAGAIWFERRPRRALTSFRSVAQFTPSTCSHCRPDPAGAVGYH